MILLLFLSMISQQGDAVNLKYSRFNNQNVHTLQTQNTAEDLSAINIPSKLIVKLDDIDAAQNASSPDKQKASHLLMDDEDLITSTTSVSKSSNIQEDYSQNLSYKDINLSFRERKSSERIRELLSDFESVIQKIAVVEEHLRNLNAARKPKVSAIDIQDEDLKSFSTATVKDDGNLTRVVTISHIFRFLARTLDKATDLHGEKLLNDHHFNELQYTLITLSKKLKAYSYGRDASSNNKAGKNLKTKDDPRRIFRPKISLLRFHKFLYLSKQVSKVIIMEKRKLLISKRISKDIGSRPILSVLSVISVCKSILTWYVERFGHTDDEFESRSLYLFGIELKLPLTLLISYLNSLFDKQRNYFKKGEFGKIQFVLKELKRHLTALGKDESYDSNSIEEAISKSKLAVFAKFDIN